jgi:hypothetical protein
MVRKGADLLKRKKEKRINMSDRCTECGLLAPNHRDGCDVTEAPEEKAVVEEVVEKVEKPKKKTTPKKKAAKKA